MAAAPTTRIIDHGFTAIIDELNALDGAGVKVGVQGDAGKDESGETDLIDIALYNEFGTASIPERPFMRDAADKYERDIGKVMEHLYGKVFDGTASVDQVQATLGEYYQGKQQEHIRSGPWEPNAPATITAKGSSRPLIDKGRMIQAVRYEKLK